MKKGKINNSTQQVVAKILRSFVFCTNAEDVKRVSEKIMAEYGLCKESFSGFPCTPEEYLESKQRDSAERCVVCGDIIPEGLQICPSCQVSAWEKSKEEGLI